VATTRLGTADVAAAIVLLVGIGLGAAALFPDFYSHGQSLADSNANLVFNIINLGGWMLAALLLLLGRTRMGAWLAAGVSASTLGFYLADGGYVVRYGLHLAALGFWLGKTSWLVCATGTALALLAARRRGVLGRLAPGPVALPLVAAVAGIAAAVAYAPGWDRYHAVATTTGRTESFTNANAFHSPAAVIVGHVVIIAVLVIAPVLATLLQPGVGAAAALAGLIIPQVANLVANLVVLLQPVEASVFGATAAQAAAVKAVFSVRATPWFWAEAVAVGLLILVFLARVLTLSSGSERQRG
jgi:hypothetical protein